MTFQEYDSQINAAFEKDDYATAYRLAQAMEKEGMNVGAYHMATASSLMENYSRADKEIDRYLSKSNDAEGWFLKGTIQMGADNYYGAAESFDKSAELGKNEALGYAAVSKFIAIKGRLNEDPNDVELNGIIYNTLEEVIVQSVACIQNNPADFAFYGQLPAFLYTDYSMFMSGRTMSETITTTKYNLFGRIISQDSYTIPGIGLSPSGNLWDMRQALKEEAAAIESKTAYAFKRAMKIANILDDCGKKAEADMVRFGMIYTEIDQKGRRGVAPDAVWFYQHGQEIARKMPAEDYKEWSDNFAEVIKDYQSLIKRFGNQIKTAQKNGYKPDFLRYYLEESRLPAAAGDYLGGTRASADVERLGGASGQISIPGILEAAGNADLLALAPTVFSGFIAYFGRRAGGAVAWVVLIFALIVFIVGLVKSSAKIPADGERKCHQAGQAAIFVLFLLNVWLGIIGTAAVKVLFRPKA